jgi:ferredoxin-NADP reductase/predicted pyridoxine 5'-phosphate oxidase superfamily flavin-nucleotide-binding protein
VVPREASVASPFHAGEQAVQERLGVREGIEPWARKVIRSVLPEEHRQFYSHLPFVVAAARDDAGRPWATLVAGTPGFIHSPDPGTLLIEGGPVAGDALYGTFSSGADVGLLGIELATRRRNRVNGRVQANDRGAVVFTVDQCFGNCPQYISEREWRYVQSDEFAATSSRTKELTADLARRIQSADTFFIATGHRADGENDEDVTLGMDASHRGGPPGFVDVVDEHTLVIPDYKGNNHFNTLGNLVMDPRAGLLFVDFETGALLQLTGRAEIDWDSDEVSRYPGARRLIRFTLEEANLLEGALPLRWDVASDSVRALRLVEKTRESADVTSFYFEAEDGRRLADFAAGQHLPIEVLLSADDEKAKRTYSLSSGPSDDRYRISVKREPQGTVSRHLHDSLEVGATLSARMPAGDFVLDHGSRPVVLVSAGIGVTPMVSMLHDLAASPESRSVWFVHGARDGEHHALADDVRSLIAARDGLHAHISYSRPLAEDRQGRDFDARGRVDGALLASILPDQDAEFYLCGPIAFMADVQSELEALGVSPAQIHSESFGAA